LIVPEEFPRLLLQGSSVYGRIYFSGYGDWLNQSHMADFLRRKLNFETMELTTNVGNKEDRDVVSKLIFSLKCEKQHRGAGNSFGQLNQVQCSTKIWDIEAFMASLDQFQLGKHVSVSGILFDLGGHIMRIGRGCQHIVVNSLKFYLVSDLTFYHVAVLNALKFSVRNFLSTDWLRWEHERLPCWEVIENAKFPIHSQLSAMSCSLTFHVELDAGLHDRVVQAAEFKVLALRHVSTLLIQFVYIPGIFYQLFFQQWDLGRIHFRSKGKLHTGSFTVWLSCFMQQNPGGSCDGHLWHFEESFTAWISCFVQWDPP
jgi:hypothetical protein